ncbi:MAG: GNAT family N-acetyltransferase [Chloroflexi bacterium]|nr:GNAT family N-acetyltransferase [Chloroflexota bacterium]
MNDFPIIRFDLKAARDTEYRAANALSNQLRAERLPDDPPIPLDEEIRNWQNIPPFVEVHAWSVWDAARARVIAGGVMSFLLMNENKHLADFNLQVLPEFRRQGIARQLLARVVADAQDAQRTLLVTNTHQRVPAGEIFMHRIGASKGLENHVNQLRIADLDRALMQAWIARAQARAKDFELGWWEGKFPDADLQAIADLYNVMNTAPRDKLQMEDFRFAPEQLRQMEKSMFACGIERWTLYARKKSSHQFAGFTEVFWHANRPAIVNQGGTGVFPQYRNLGLGRWLKAAMLEKILRERAQVKFVRTGNADSNAAMLKINSELGFQPYSADCIWQVETEKVVEYLGEKQMLETLA